MAIITNALLTALHVTYRNDFERGQARAEPQWDRVATEVPSGGKSSTYGWLGRFPKMREWIGDRAINDMKAHSYSITNRTFEATVAVSRDDIEDDATGTYSPMFEEMGYSERTQVDEELWPLLAAGDANLCYDGQFFFDTDHPVAANHDGTGAVTSVSNITAGAGPKWYLMCTKRPLKPMIYQNRRRAQFVTKFDPQTSDHVFMTNDYLWGVDKRFDVGFGFWQFAHMSQADLTSDNLQAVYQQMMKTRADGGKPLGVIPDLLVVPPDLDGAATVAVKNMFDAAGASNKTYQKVDCVTVPWLAAA